MKSGKKQTAKPAKPPAKKISVIKKYRTPRLVHLAQEPESACGTKPLTSIDLFAGAGGITEGFRQAGYQCLYANDFNHWAVETFKANHPGVLAECKPIEEVNAAALRTHLGLEPGELDVLVGGPPCQGFSINAPERVLDDPRNSLVKHYIRFIDEFRPKTFLIENVPGMLSLGNGVVFEGIIQALRKRGYDVRYRILFAAQYGVPQERWRMIILGSSTGAAVEHPYPTHAAQARANFLGGRTHTFKLGPLELATLEPAVTVREAIGDLPRLKMGEGSEIINYDKPAQSSYGEAMRGSSEVTYNHFAAKLSQQNVARMQHIGPGGSWRDIPDHLLPKGMLKARKSDHTKRYGRLKHNGLAGTILTKCDPHWSAVILPDQDRTLTVREAARIQSFPDSYKFLGPRVAQYEQVGNAVPPLMAKAIAESIRTALQGASAQRSSIHVA